MQCTAVILNCVVLYGVVCCDVRRVSLGRGSEAHCILVGEHIVVLRGVVCCGVAKCTVV